MTSWLNDLWFRLRATWQRETIDREMDAEFRFHIEQATERNLARGLSPERARTEALRTFGGVSMHKEIGGDEFRHRWLEELAGDVKYAARTLRKNPRFTAATVLTIGVAIAANTAVFSVVNGVLLRPLPFPESNRLVYIGWDYGNGNRISSLSFFQLSYARERSGVFDGVMTWRTFERPIGGPDDFDMASGLTVSKDFFQVTRIRPVLGRTFDEAEHQPGAADVALLGNAFWRDRFAAREDVLGKTLQLDGRTYTVIGVMPPGFKMPNEAAPDVLVAMRLQPNPNDGGQNYNTLARLRPGISAARIDADLKSISREIIAEHPDVLGGKKSASAAKPSAGFVPMSFTDAYVGTLQRTLWILLGAVGFVALIACANVANLLLVRAAGREREIAVRATLGAGRGRIARQLLVESLLLSCIGGALGLAAGLWGVRGLLALAPNALPRIDEIGFDWRVALFTGGVSVLTGLVFGTISALPGTRAGLLGVLGRGSSRGATGAGSKVREVLIAAETAIAVVLLAGSGLLIASFARLRAVDPGFDVSNLITVRFGRMPAAYNEEGRQGDFEKRLLAELRSTPGVEAAAALPNFPLQRGMNLPMAIEGRPDDFEGAVEWRTVSDEYFKTFRMAMLSGRDFSPDDKTGAPRVAIINAAMARRYWPNENPIGKRIEIGKWQGRWISPGFAGAAEVIAVVGDVREIGLAQPPHRTVYVPRAQWEGALSSPRFVIRAAAGERLAPLVEAAVRRVDARVKPPTFESMPRIVDASVTGQRFEATVLALFAGTALLLTAIGIYGVVASAVSAREREIGIRMALGAQAMSVVRSIVSRGMLLVSGGAVVGLIAAMASTRLLASKLFGVTPTDVRTLGSSLLVLIAVSMVAAWIPAHRATRVQPSDALKSD
jgi:predicted permease